MGASDIAVGFLITVFACTQTNTDNITRIEKTPKIFQPIEWRRRTIVRRFELYQYGYKELVNILTLASSGLRERLFRNYFTTRDVNVEFPGALLVWLYSTGPPEEFLTSFLASARLRWLGRF